MMAPSNTYTMMIYMMIYTITVLPYENVREITDMIAEIYLFIIVGLLLRKAIIGEKTRNLNS